MSSVPQLGHRISSVTPRLLPDAGAAHRTGSPSSTASPSYARAGHREVCGAQRSSGRRRSPRTAAGLRRRRCGRAGLRVVRSTRRGRAAAPRAHRADGRAGSCGACRARAPNLARFSTDRDAAGARREPRRRVQPHDRAALGLARLASPLVATPRTERSGRDRARPAPRATPRYPAGSWRMRGSLRSPGRLRSIPPELLLWPRFATWTKLSVEPQRAVHVDRRYFRNGHQAIDALCAELIHELAAAPPLPVVDLDHLARRVRDVVA